MAHGNFSGVCGVSLADKLLPLTSAANTGPSAGVAISFRLAGLLFSLWYEAELCGIKQNVITPCCYYSH